MSRKRGKKSGGVIYSSVSSIPQYLNTSLGSEGLGTGNDTVGAVDNRTSRGEADEF
jgi:hypothetical protein